MLSQSHFREIWYHILWLPILICLIHHDIVFWEADGAVRLGFYAVGKHDAEDDGDDVK